MTQTALSLSQLAKQIGAEIIGDGSVMVAGLNSIQDADSSQMCFLSSDKHGDKLAATRAAAVMTPHPLPACPLPQLIVKDILTSLIAVQKLFAPTLTVQQGIHPSAIVEPTAQVAPTASIAAGAYIGHHVCIGEKTIIGVHCSIGQGTVIGSGCRLDSNVVVYHNCRIGNACIIQANSTIGAVGFGYSFIGGRHELMPHNGGVIIEDGVEIGANSCVDRAKFGNTIIGAGTKIDNLVQIAHNVVIGKLCLIAGQVGMAGSVHLGDGVVLAGQVGVVDNITIGSGAVVGARALVASNVGPGQKVWGTPAIELRNQLKSVAVFKQLPEIAKEVKQLSQKVKKLESTENH